MPVVSRALETLTALLKRRGEWSASRTRWLEFGHVVVGSTNLKVHMSALRDGRDGDWFIVNVPGLAAT